MNLRVNIQKSLHLFGNLYENEYKNYMYLEGFATTDYN